MGNKINDISNDLRNIKNLLDEGIIDEGEYSILKDEILKNIGTADSFEQKNETKSTADMDSKAENTISIAEPVKAKASSVEKKKNKSFVVPVVIVAIVCLVGLFVWGNSNGMFASTPNEDGIEYVPESKEMPDNGHVFYNRRNNLSEEDRKQVPCSDFKIVNNSTSAYYVKMVETYEDASIIEFFVRPSSKVNIDVPCFEGHTDFKIKYASGYEWYGKADMFGDETQYSESDDIYDFKKYTWTITLNTRDGAGEEFDSHSIDKSAF